MRSQTLTAFDVELHTDATTDAWKGASVTRKLQISGGLELKMFHALDAAIASGYDRAAIVGTDAPNVPLGHVESLLRSEADVALGRADDGGFWGVSARRTNPGMFAGVRWSRGDTLDQTVRALNAVGLSVEIGPTWFDVDNSSDLDRLLASPDLPPATTQWANRYLKVIAARTAGL